MVGILGLAWLGVAILKVESPQEFQRFLQDLGFGTDLSRVGVWVVITFEAAFGLAFLFGVLQSRDMGLLVWVSLLLSAAIVALTLFMRTPAACGCFGRLIEGSRQVRIVVAATMAALAAAALLCTRPHSGSLKENA